MQTASSRTSSPRMTFGNAVARSGIISASALLLLLGLAAGAVAEPVMQALPYKFKAPSSMLAGKSYSFTFNLYDSASQAVAAVPLWSETKSLKIPANHVVTHLLGSVTPFSNSGTALPPVDFGRQLYVEVRRGAKILGGGRVPLGPIVPYALQSVLAGSINTTMIQDGSITADDLENGAALSEVLDNDGVGSTLDADLLDGMHAAAFAPVDHTHSSLPSLDVQGPIHSTGRLSTDSYLNADWASFSTSSAGFTALFATSTGTGATEGVVASVTSTTGKAIVANVAGTTRMNVDIDGVHAGPGMTGTALAQGNVSSNGTVLFKTSNVGTVTHPATGEFTIPITGETLAYSTHGVNLTPLWVSPVFATWSVTSGSLVVHMWDPAGNPINASFTFAVYKN